MTGGQNDLLLEAPKPKGQIVNAFSKASADKKQTLKVINANEAELAQHDQWLTKIRQKDTCLWPE